MSVKLWIGKKMYLVDEEVAEYVVSLEIYERLYKQMKQAFDEEPDQIFDGKHLSREMSKALKAESSAQSRRDK